MADKPTQAKKPRPNIRQRRVASALKKWRLASGYSQDKVAEQLHWSQPKVQRLENATTIAGPAEVYALVAIFGISDKERDRVLNYVEAGQQGLVWWRAYSDSDDFADFMETESDAKWVGNKGSVLIPGLLQTREYTDALARAWTPDPDESAVEKRRALRQQRQARLTNTESPLHLHAILDEVCLLRPVGDDAVMAGQVDHLLEMGRLPNITIQVIPMSKGAYPGYGLSYHLMTFEGDEDAAALYVENLTSGLYIESASDVEAYTLNFERLKDDPDIALTSDKSARLIAGHRATG